MSQNTQLTIKEFSRLTGIKPDNLRFYDRIGLLSPDMRGDYNNYRYYSKYQVNTAYLISSLRGMGVGIEDIKRYTASPTSLNTLALFEQQDARIEAEIQHLVESQEILHLYADMLKEALEHGEDDIYIEEKNQEEIFLCPIRFDEMDEDEGIVRSYEYAGENGVNLGYPCGTLVFIEKLGTKDVESGGSVYFKVGSGGNAVKKAGKYAVAYGKCDMWKTEGLYHKLEEYIQKQGLHICGDIYEEYPAGISILETETCCIKLEVQVE